MTTAIAIYVTDGGAFVERSHAPADGRQGPRSIRWQLPTLELPRQAGELPPVAMEIGATLQREFPEGVVARLAIPAHWCFCEVIRMDGSDKSDDALAYGFEENLPVELEQLTWAVTKAGSSCKMIAAVFTEPLRAFLDKLQEHGVAVELLTVDAALMLAERCGDRASQTAVSSQDHTTIVSSIEGGGACVRAFRDLEGRCGEHHRRLTEACTGHAATADATGNGHGAAQLDGEAAASLVLQALSTTPAPLDLRRGHLAYAGRWDSAKCRFRRCAATAVVLLFVLGARLHWDSLVYGDALARLTEVQAQLSRRVFPDTPVQSGAALRLRSERIRLEALTRTGEAGELPQLQKDLETFQLLHQLTASIPPHVRLHVNEIEVDAEGIRVAGQTAAHTAAGEWVQEINRTNSLRADPPRTTLRKDGTVDFRIFAKWEASDEAP